MKIPCTNCNQHLEIPEELAGQTIECPACNTSLAVPALVQEETPQVASGKNYPIELNFKKIALSKQAMLTDSKGNSVAYARQKVLKLKEELEVFEDKSKAKRICTIKANKVIDFSAAYHFYTENKKCFGSVQRKGLLSIWKRLTLSMIPAVINMQQLKKRTLLQNLLTLCSEASLLLALFATTFLIRHILQKVKMALNSSG